MKVIKFCLFVLLIIGLTSALALAIGVWMALEPESALPDSTQTPQASSLYPALQQFADSEDGTLTLQDQDLSEFGRQQLRRMGIAAAVDVHFSPQTFNAELSTVLPLEFNRRYANISVAGSQSAPPEHLRITQLQVGKLIIPQIVLHHAVPYATNRCKRDRRCRAAMDAYRNIESMEFHSGFMKLRYRLGAETLDQLSIGALNIDDLALEPYLTQLNVLVARSNQRRIALHTALQVVMQEASQRSQQHNAIKENTAALLALALQNADAPLQRMILANQHDSALPVSELPIFVHRRRDLAQHFVNSAALYLIGGTEFSDYIGIYKEFYDVSRGKEFGTGDLIADRAGVRFAQRATQSEVTARALQQRILKETDTTAYLLSKTEIRELEQQYNVRTTEEINEIVTVIDKALAPLPLLN